MAPATIERPAQEPKRSRTKWRIPAVVAIVCAIAVAVVDGIVAHGFPERLWVAGVLDETAHASTTIILVAAFAYAVERRFLIGALLGSVLIDTDHVPTHLGWNGLEQMHTREYPHSLATVAVFLVLGLLFRGRTRLFWLGIAVGLMSHLFRDFSEPANDSPGVPLFWPLSDQGVKLPYAVYAGVVATLLVVALGRRVWWWRSRS